MTTQVECIEETDAEKGTGTGMDGYAARTGWGEDQEVFERLEVVPPGPDCVVVLGEQWQGMGGGGTDGTGVVRAIRY